MGALNAGMLALCAGVAGGVPAKGFLSSGYQTSMVAAAAGAGALN